MNWYKESQNLCETDMTPRQLIQEESPHGLGMTKAFKLKIKPILDSFVTPVIAKELEPLERRWGENYLRLFWEQSFMKNLNPKDNSRCNNSWLEWFIDGDWNNLSKIFLKMLISSAKKIDTKKENVKNRLINSNGDTTTSFYRKMQNQFEDVGINIGFATGCVRNNIPAGVKDLFMNGDFDGATRTIIEYYLSRNKDRKNKSGTENELINIYEKIVSPSIFLHNANFVLDDLRRVLYHKEEYTRSANATYDKSLKDAIQQQDWNRATAVLEKWVRTMPKFIFPLIYRQYVENEIPGWPYQSFFYAVINYPEFKRAIIDDDIATIKKWVQDFKGRRNMPVKTKFYDDSRYYSDPKSHRAIVPPAPGDSNKKGPSYSPKRYLDNTEEQRELVQNISN